MTDTAPHYTIEVYRDEERVRTHVAQNVPDALNLIDGLRESYKQRNHVTWNGDEVDNTGRLQGHDEGDVWTLKVTPPLGTIED